MNIIKLAMDAPKGARIVGPSTYAGQPLAGATIADVAWNIDAGTVRLDFTDGGSLEVLSHLELTLDLDTSERRDRLAFADWVLSGGWR